MNTITLQNIYTSLSNAVPDPAVGISLAHLMGDENFSYYVTQIPPQSQLTAHFHQHGNELYQVIEGKGVIWITDAKTKNLAHQNTRYDIGTGDTFLVPEMTIHQLSNPGPKPLIMMFGCPQSHITSDRQLTENFNHFEGEK